MADLALIVGVGDGLSASLARLFAAEGYDLALAARNTDKLTGLVAETGASQHMCDASDPSSVEALFAAVPAVPDVVIYNPSARVRGPVQELEPEAVRKALEVTAFGAFLVARAVVPGMVERGSGTILMTGASAGVKGFPNSSSFAMGKFAQRGLAQSLSRELHPKGIHVAWINIDGAIRNPGRTEEVAGSMLDPDAIAREYLGLVRQDRSTWSNELTVRPWVERF
ncbi:SDR family NAD(P)-dependent oxidoreductase [Pontivivens ytuae]|uniref:SDR family NAD(P)-dependent oxidoreductase n=1 Tax=Pontivivens ytuae TaxID=2789856 RepID=A0A7S9LVE2_9RHOB|nr:SDR family NAD(P)-dependent oxidoreductase [Pontivivens ytuae]QPH55819.1 SDR family NAD(P)-dependent oxidoreductase [Pontivivens ytuae]